MKAWEVRGESLEAYQKLTLERIHTLRHCSEGACEEEDGDELTHRWAAGSKLTGCMEEDVGSELAHRSTAGQLSGQSSCSASSSVLGTFTRAPKNLNRW